MGEYLRGGRQFVWKYPHRQEKFLSGGPRHHPSIHIPSYYWVYSVEAAASLNGVFFG